MEYNKENLVNVRDSLSFKRSLLKDNSHKARSQKTSSISSKSQNLPGKSKLPIPKENNKLESTTSQSNGTTVVLLSSRPSISTSSASVTTKENHQLTREEKLRLWQAEKEKERAKKVVPPKKAVIAAPVKPSASFVRKPIFGFEMFALRQAVKEARSKPTVEEVRKAFDAIKADQKRFYKVAQCAEYWISRARYEEETRNFEEVIRLYEEAAKYVSQPLILAEMRAFMHRTTESAIAEQEFMQEIDKLNDTISAEEQIQMIKDIVSKIDTKVPDEDITPPTPVRALILDPPTPKAETRQRNEVTSAPIEQPALLDEIAPAEQTIEVIEETPVEVPAEKTEEVPVELAPVESVTIELVPEVVKESVAPVETPQETKEEAPIQVIQSIPVVEVTQVEEAAPATPRKAPITPRKAPVEAPTQLIEVKTPSRIRKSEVFNVAPIPRRTLSRELRVVLLRAITSVAKNILRDLVRVKLGNTKVQKTAEPEFRTPSKPARVRIADVEPEFASGLGFEEAKKASPTSSSMIVLTPVSTSKSQRMSMKSSKVLTPARRSTRISGAYVSNINESHVADLLKQTSYTYSPNVALLNKSAKMVFESQPSVKKVDTIFNAEHDALADYISNVPAIGETKEVVSEPMPVVEENEPVIEVQEKPTKSFQTPSVKFSEEIQQNDVVIEIIENVSNEEEEEEEENRIKKYHHTTPLLGRFDTVIPNEDPTSGRKPLSERRKSYRSRKSTPGKKSVEAVQVTPVRRSSRISTNFVKLEDGTPIVIKPNRFLNDFHLDDEETN